MEQKKTDTNKEARILRKKIKRVEESRALIKAKNRKKGTAIKKSEDRQKELMESRDRWKDKCKQTKKEKAEISEQYAHLANLFQMKEEKLREVMVDFERLKKKYPEMCQ